MTEEMKKKMEEMAKDLAEWKAQAEKLAGALRLHHKEWAQNTGDCLAECTDTCKALRAYKDFKAKEEE